MNDNLKRKLETHYKAFDKTKITPDPLQFLHKYSCKEDIEIMGFIASVFSYGNVKQIINTLNRLTSVTGNEPYEFVKNFDKKKQSFRFNNLQHRFYPSADIINLFEVLKIILNEYSSINNFYMQFYNSDSINLKYNISRFSQELIRIYLAQTKKLNPSFGIIFMFPDPLKGSACKRMNLFLRWMVRKDELDFGLWNEIPTNKLIIPVDIHIAKICKSLGLTNQKNVSWKMAEEITEKLKMFDPIDPVKYDFALCHIGMRKIQF